MDEIINEILTWLLTPLVLGFILDSLIGDPVWFPHPIRLFGKLIFLGEKILNKGKNKILKGGILLLLLIGFVFLFLFYLVEFLNNYPHLQLIVESIFVFFGMANRNLIEECLKVEKVLEQNGLIAARKQLSAIVGRDTDNLSEKQVRIASLETLSENLSDGVIAPLLYYALGGIPMMFAYKMVNTLDSMIAYKNDRYLKFGRIAAKTDDVLNFVPARITAFLMVLLSFSWRGLVFILRYGNKHSSPNAGYPEAALAGILNCQFGGSNFYHHRLVEKPKIGRKDREISKTDLTKAVAINWGVTFIFVAVLAFLLN